MRYSNTAITELTKRYRNVLLKCALLNAALLLSVPAMAISLNNTTYDLTSDETIYANTTAESSGRYAGILASGTSSVDTGDYTLTIKNDTSSSRNYGWASNDPSGDFTFTGNLDIDIDSTGSTQARGIRQNAAGSAEFDGSVTVDVSAENAYVYGTDVWSGGSVKFTGDLTDITATGGDTTQNGITGSTEVYGAYLQGGGTIDFEATTTNIKASNSTKNLGGAMVYGGTINFAGQDTTITAENSSNVMRALEVIGTEGETSTVNFTGDTVSLNSKNNQSTYTGTGTLKEQPIDGILISGEGATLNIESNTFDINVESTKMASSGISMQYDTTINIADNTTVNLNVSSSETSGYAYGVFAPHLNDDSSGTIISEGKINATINGSARAEGVLASNATMELAHLNATVTSTEGKGVGINLKEGSDVTVSDLTLDITGKAGAWGGNIVSSNLTLDGTETNITTTSESGAATGIWFNVGEVALNADTTNILANGGTEAYGIRALSDPNLLSNVTINGSNVNIEANGKSYMSIGIVGSGPSATIIEADTVNIKATSEEGNAYAIATQYGNKFSLGSGETTLTAEAKNAAAIGIFTADLKTDLSSETSVTSTGKVDINASGAEVYGIYNHDTSKVNIDLAEVNMDINATGEGIGAYLQTTGSVSLGDTSIVVNAGDKAQGIQAMGVDVTTGTLNTTVSSSEGKGIGVNLKNSSLTTNDLTLDVSGKAGAWGANLVKSDLTVNGATTDIKATNADGLATGIWFNVGEINLNTDTTNIVAEGAEAYGIRALSDPNLISNVNIKGSNVNIEAHGTNGLMSVGIVGSGPSSTNIEADTVNIEATSEDGLAYAIAAQYGNTMSLGSGNVTLTATSTNSEAIGILTADLKSDLSSETSITSTGSVTMNVSGKDVYGIHNYDTSKVDINLADVTMNITGSGEATGAYLQTTGSVSLGDTSIVVNAGDKAQGIQAMGVDVTTGTLNTTVSSSEGSATALNMTDGSSLSSSDLTVAATGKTSAKGVHIDGSLTVTGSQVDVSATSETDIAAGIVLSNGDLNLDAGTAAGTLTATATSSEASAAGIVLSNADLNLGTASTTVTATGAIEAVGIQAIEADVTTGALNITSTSSNGIATALNMTENSTLSSSDLTVSANGKTDAVGVNVDGSLTVTGSQVDVSATSEEGIAAGVVLSNGSLNLGTATTTVTASGATEAVGIQTTGADVTTGTLNTTVSSSEGSATALKMDGSSLSSSDLTVSANGKTSAVGVNVDGSLTVTGSQVDVSATSEEGIAAGVVLSNGSLNLGTATTTVTASGATEAVGIQTTGADVTTGTLNTTVSSSEGSATALKMDGSSLSSSDLTVSANGKTSAVGVNVDGSLTVTGSQVAVSATSETGVAGGIVLSNGSLDLGSATTTVTVNAETDAIGIQTTNVDMNISGTDVYVTANGKSGLTTGVQSIGTSTTTIDALTVDITATSETGSSYALSANALSFGNAKTSLKSEATNGFAVGLFTPGLATNQDATNISITGPVSITATGSEAAGIFNMDTSKIDIDLAEVTINATGTNSGYGAYLKTTGNVSLGSEGKTSTITATGAESYGLYIGSGSNVTLAGNMTVSGETADIHNDGTLTIGDNITLTNGIDGTGSITFEADTVLNATLSETTIKADSVEIEKGAEVDLLITGGIKAGTYEFITADSLNGTFEIADNGQYLIDNAEDGSITITQKSEEQISEEIGASAEETSALMAMINADGNSTEIGNLIAAELSKALQQGNPEPALKVSQALTPTQPNVVPTIEQDKVLTMIGLADTRMAKIGKGRSGGDMRHSGGLWVQGLYNKSKQDRTASNSGFNAYSRGLALGFDHVLTDDVTVGIGYGFTETDTKAGGRDSTIDGHNVFVYGEYQPSQWYVNSVLNYGFAKYKESKSALGVALKDKYDVNTYGAQVMTGYDFANGITPEAGLRYVLVDADTYSDGFQRVKTKNNDVLTAVAGVKYAPTYYNCNWKFQPTARVALTYDLISDGTNANVSVYGGGTYRVEGQRLHRLGVEGSLGLTTSYKNIDMTLEYNGSLRQDYSSQGGIARLKYNF